MVGKLVFKLWQKSILPHLRCLSLAASALVKWILGVPILLLILVTFVLAVILIWAITFLLVIQDLFGEK